MIEIQDDLLRDIKAVRQIPIVPSMLEVICQTTEMGFAAIARVTEDRWVACSVRDEVEFGLKEGGELEVKTTICNEIRDSREPVVIDHVDKDPHYKFHHTPQIYGLQSYISYPIILRDGSFFGTLCAIDAQPAKVNNPKVINTFKMFAELLSFHLQSQDLLERSYHTTAELQKQNEVLTIVNNDMDNFIYTASHDLKSPINNIEGLINALSHTLEKENLNRDELNKIIHMMKISVKRFALTIQDLTTIVKADSEQAEEITETVNLFETVENVKQDLISHITSCNAKINISCEDGLALDFSKKSFHSIIYNLLSNAIKYRSPERLPEVEVKLHKVDGKVNLSVTDNGLGIPADKQEKLFTMFERFHDHVEGSGVGLYIVKRMVDKAQGQISVSSTESQGTTFTIIFN
ncbi:ATP-binding protein [Cesiribacter sp. SM1]|uniref:sensor histidine kinase n=1 Tax=Cesiribacter sp. SM1 TaxID=2861196 RepID=UPI001CD764D4|nr:GAF domain-containing sensor histidine kinase [Cesiribacter sp. SM1]